MANLLARQILLRRVSNFTEICGTLSCQKHCSFSQDNNLRRSLKKSRQNVSLIRIGLPGSSTLRHYSGFDDKKDPNAKQCEIDQADDKTKKLTLFQKFKQMYRDYWYVLLPVHVVTSAVWFGGFYYMAKSGLDIVVILESWNVSEKIINPLRDSSMGYVAVSYALYKIATPARYTVTLGGTTLSINYLKKWGYIKPVPTKERMKEIFQEQKDTLAKSMKETKHGLLDKKDNLIETLKETKEGIIEKKDHLVQSVSKTKMSIEEKKSDIKQQISKIKDDMKGKT